MQFGMQGSVNRISLKNINGLNGLGSNASHLHEFQRQDPIIESIKKI
jgi:hypothetical protein